LTTHDPRNDILTTYTVFTWYTHHGLHVTPVNPSAATIKAFPPFPDLEIKEYPAIPNLSALPHPTETSVSKVTVKVLEEAKKLGIKSVWLQPGTFDDEILKKASEDFQAAVGGAGGRGGEGWCVLVDGEAAAKGAGLKL
jgi:predicted CoA-binding protein